MNTRISDASPASAVVFSSALVLLAAACGSGQNRPAGGSGGATASGGAGGGASGDAGATGSGGGAGTSATGGAAGGDSTDDGLIGFATVHPNGPPTGGSKPVGTAPVMTCTASDMKTLRDCVYRAKKSDKANTDIRPNAPDWSSWEVHGGVTSGWKNYPVVIYIKGVIEGSHNDAGKAMTQADYEAGDALCGVEIGAICQQAVIQAKIERDNVSVIGIPGANGEAPTLNGGWLMFRGQSNIIVRNLRIVNATDFWTSFESCSAGTTDRDYCAWNAEPDGLTLDNTNRAWIDHCEFTDGPDWNGVNPDKTLYKMYDGLLDIKNGSDFVTLSYNKFSNHNKAMLVGATDSADGDYNITFHHNLISYVQQRMPRVRNGHVHVLNNYYVGKAKADYTQEYFFGYAIGLGYNSQVYSERNSFDVEGATANMVLNANFDAWAQVFTDVGSWVSGQAVDLNQAAAAVINARNTAMSGSTPFVGPVQWNPADRYPYAADQSAAAVAARVSGRAGVGRVPPDPTL